MAMAAPHDELLSKGIKVSAFKSKIKRVDKKAQFTYGSRTLHLKDIKFVLDIVKDTLEVLICIKGVRFDKYTILILDQQHISVLQLKMSWLY